MTRTTTTRTRPAKTAKTAIACPSTSAREAEGLADVARHFRRVSRAYAHAAGRLEAVSSGVTLDPIEVQRTPAAASLLLRPLLGKGGDTA